MKETCDTCIHAEVCKYTKELNGCDFWQNPFEKIRDEMMDAYDDNRAHDMGDVAYGIKIALQIMMEHTKGE